MSSPLPIVEAFAEALADYGCHYNRCRSRAVTCQRCGADCRDMKTIATMDAVETPLKYCIYKVMCIPCYEGVCKYFFDAITKAKTDNIVTERALLAFRDDKTQSTSVRAVIGIFHFASRRPELCDRKRYSDVAFWREATGTESVKCTCSSCRRPFADTDPVTLFNFAEGDRLVCEFCSERFPKVKVVAITRKAGTGPSATLYRDTPVALHHSPHTTPSHDASATLFRKDVDERRVHFA